MDVILMLNRKQFEEVYECMGILKGNHKLNNLKRCWSKC